MWNRGRSYRHGIISSPSSITPSLSSIITLITLIILIPIHHWHCVDDTTPHNTIYVYTDTGALLITLPPKRKGEKKSQVIRRGLRWVRT